MIYYKKLDLDFDVVAKKTLLYATLHKKEINSFWNNFNFEDFVKHVPEITTMFAPLNITPKHVSLIVAIQATGIHRDHTDSIARINIPILNCKYSQTKFWKTSVEPIVLTLENNVPYLHLNEADCEVTDVLVLDRATVLRVTEPHSVHVGHQVPRISLTIDFKENIEYLLD
jgi:hypothetical protein